MLSLNKIKVCKEYIYSKKHVVSLWSLEDVYVKFKNSKDVVFDMTNFYLNEINFEKLRFILKIVSNMDGKTALNLAQVKDYVEEMMIKAMENYVKNSMDGVYVSEHIVVIISPYGGKHYISVCPRIDFLK